MANDQATNGKRVLVSSLSKLYRYGQLTNNVFFKIFDTNVPPILMYGAEIWGIQARQEVERVQYCAFKRFLCARHNSTNDAVMGDRGRYPLYVTMAIVFKLRKCRTIDMSKSAIRCSSAMMKLVV